MTAPRRKLLKAYVKPELHSRITDLARRSNLSASRVVERLLETGRMPDRSADLLIVNLLQVNADQARLGNLLLKGLNETVDGHVGRQMQTLLGEIRQTQVEIKARIAELQS